MNESPSLAELLPAHARDPQILEDIEAFAPELNALRDARQRAFDGRVAAEHALRAAEVAEAELRAREEEALAAVAARRQQLAEAARQREREASERVAELEARLQRSVVATEQAQLASNAAALARDEAQRTLDRLAASCLDLHERLQTVASERQTIENELANARHAADAATQAREQLRAPAIAVVPPPAPVAPVGLIAAPQPEPVKADVAVLAERIDVLQQRAAERRAADALRMKTG